MNFKLFFIILFFGLLLITLGLIVFSYVLRIYDFQEVLTNGIPTKALIVRKYARNRIILQYQDISGRMHRKDVIVLLSEYHRFQVGDSIDIEYSARRPHISLFKETVDQSRAARQETEQSKRDSSE